MTTRIHQGEVRRVLNSAGVQGIIERESAAAAARCNALVNWHSPMDADAYGSDTVDAGGVRIGIVGMRRLGPDSMAVAYENAKHNTLLKGSGW